MNSNWLCVLFFLNIWTKRKSRYLIYFSFKRFQTNNNFIRNLIYIYTYTYVCMYVKRVNCVKCEIRANRPNGPIGESRTSISTCPTKVGPILSHGPPVGTKAQTCPSRFKKLVLQAREACPASLRGLFSRSGWLPQQVCEACSARKGGKTSLL